MLSWTLKVRLHAVVNTTGEAVMSDEAYQREVVLVNVCSDECQTT
jgi:hypothetical protein